MGFLHIVHFRIRDSRFGDRGLGSHASTLGHPTARGGGGGKKNFFYPWPLLQMPRLFSLLAPIILKLLGILVWTVLYNLDTSGIFSLLGGKVLI
jgi:hypothetical protein